MSVKYSNHFSFKRLLKLVYPSIIMMVFTSIYGVVDGVFVSNFAGTTPEQCETAFAAVNLIMPVLMAFASFGFMIGTGGSALISKLLGEGKEKRANGIFSLLIIVTVILGAVVTLVGEFTLRPLAILLKAEGEILDDCVLYGTICLGGAIPFMLQNVFQSFFPVAGKHKLGLVFIIAAGLTNAALDAVLIAGFKLGLVGAAAATVTGQVVGGIAPIIYFAACRKGVIKLCKPCFSIKSILKTFMNGSSEMITNLSLSLVNIIYNYQLMRLIGEEGVAAYGVIMYVSFIFVSVFLGYSVGVAPVIGYNYGAGNKDELKNVLKKSLILVSIFGAAMFGLSMALRTPLSYAFVSGSSELMQLTKRAFLIYNFVYLIVGFNILGSAFFTALNNGVISLVISFMRTLVFQIAAVLLLPLAMELDGVWLAPVAAEVLGIVLTVIFFITQRKRYGY